MSMIQFNFMLKNDGILIDWKCWSNHAYLENNLQSSTSLADKKSGDKIFVFCHLLWNELDTSCEWDLY